MVKINNEELLQLTVNVMQDLSENNYKGDYAKKTSKILFEEHGIKKTKNAIIGLLRRNGYSIAQIRRVRDLDLDKVVSAYKLYTYNPVSYTIDKSLIEYNKSVDHKILCLGDFQAGSMRNAQGHDPTPIKTLEKRFDILKTKFIKSFSREPFKKLTIFLLGDLVDGELIYPGQKTIPIQQQVIKITDLIYDFVKYISSMVDDITIFSVAGNHGRLSKYYQKESNWDSVVAYILSLRFNHEGNVKMDFNDERYQLVDVDKWKFLIHHGDFTRSFDPNKWFEFIQKYKLFKWSDMNAVVIGHWHRIFMGETFEIPLFVNGTMYESEFVQEVLAGRESLAFLLLTVGETKPVETVEVLDLRG